MISFGRQALYGVLGVCGLKFGRPWRIIQCIFFMSCHVTREQKIHQGFFWVDLVRTISFLVFSLGWTEKKRGWCVMFEECRSESPVKEY